MTPLSRHQITSSPIGNGGSCAAQDLGHVIPDHCLSLEIACGHTLHGDDRALHVCACGRVFNRPLALQATTSIRVRLDFAQPFGNFLLEKKEA